MNAPTLGRSVVAEPGLYDMTDVEYHSDPVPAGSLSSSGARKLLPPYCPALFRHEQIHGQKTRPEFDFGHVAHRLVLGDGPEIAEIKAEDWKKPATRADADAARTEGKVPLLSKDLAKVKAMADAITAHPLARNIFTAGEPERSAFWVDELTGIWRRARFDWLPHPTASRIIIRDYKTTKSANPDALRRSIADYGYHQQDPWYRDAIVALGLDDDPAFVFVFQEKEPPYLVTVVELDNEAVRFGRERNRRAIEVYAECLEHDTWPGYADPNDIHLLGLPYWARAAHRREYAA